MGWLSGNSNNKVDWNELTSIDQLNEILADSSQAHLLFKHSTRCSISTMAKSRFENEWNSESEIKLWHLDLIKHRDVSNAIEAKTGVYHQSPQAILISNKEVKYQATHGQIDARAIQKA
ncbi:MAG: bacillithiol system protein YtxJ [Psychromonas sp.]|jgi:bacillithiol system protein YtxJ